MTDGRARKVTLRDVASRAGVHVSTVSRVLNDRAFEGRIADETADRIHAAARDVGYLPNSVGRALRTGRSGFVGMVVPDIGNLYQAGITEAAATALTAHRYSLLLASTSDRLSVAGGQVAALISAQAEGFLYGAARRGDAVLTEIRAAGIPVVLFNRTDGSEDLSAVLPDDALGITAALEHLFELGHRRLAHVAGPADVSSGQERDRAFQRVVRDRGLDAVSVHADRHTEEEGQRLGAAVLAEHPDVTAIVASNDRLALGVIDAVRSSGRRCPEEVSVVGFNDMPYAERFAPPLTTLRVSQQRLGEEAARALVRAIEAPDEPPSRVLIEPTLVVRGSTGPAPPSRD